MVGSLSGWADGLLLTQVAVADALTGVDKQVREQKERGVAVSLAISKDSPHHLLGGFKASVRHG
jgi:hypothetical protein